MTTITIKGMVAAVCYAKYGQPNGVRLRAPSAFTRAPHGMSRAKVSATGGTHARAGHSGA